MSIIDNTTPLKLGYVGIGRYLPPHILTNEDLERLVDTSDEWIKQRTGINTRHIMGPEDSVANMATEAAREAIEHAGIDKSQISTIQIGVNTHIRFPSLAAIVSKRLGIKNASSVDICAGCSAFIFSVENIYHRLQSEWLTMGKKSYGLAIGVDGLSLIVDWEDRGTCVLFGDAAGAAVIGPVENGEILATFTRTHGEYDDLLYLDEFLKIPYHNTDEMQPEIFKSCKYPFMRMDGRKVFQVAVRSMISDIRTVMERYNKMSGENIKLSDIGYVIPHQANLRIVSAVQKGLDLTDDKVYRDGIINYGNTSSASIPLGYCDTWGKMPGALVVDVAFGAGFASGAILRKNPK